MPIPITCSSCGVKFNAPDAAVGKRGACPKCKAPITVPDPNAVSGFEVVEDEVIDVAEVIEDEPAPVVAKAVPGGKGKFVKPRQRNKSQVDESDYRTKVNGKPLALKAGQKAPPPIPRKSEPRE
jgi:hypothetical protein